MHFSPLDLTDATTIEQLNDRMVDWRQTAADAGLVAVAFEVGRYLAADDQPAYPYSGRPAPRRHKIGNLVLHYWRTYDIDNGFQAYAGEFETVVLTLGGRPGHELIGGLQVARFFRYKLAGADHAAIVKPAAIQQKEDEAFLNPFAGEDWPVLLMSQAPVATAAAIAAKEKSTDRKRADLIHYWGIGGAS